MNPETEKILNALGYCQSDDPPDEMSGTVRWIRPNQPELSIDLLPKAAPPAILYAIFDAGARAARCDIRQKHSACIESFHE